MFRAARHRHVLRGDEISLADQRRIRGSLEMTQPRAGSAAAPGHARAPCRPGRPGSLGRLPVPYLPSCVPGVGPGSRPPSAAGSRPGPPPAGTTPRTRTDLLTVEGRRLIAWIADHFLKPDPSRFSGSSGVPRLASSAQQITRFACLKWTRPKRPFYYISADIARQAVDVGEQGVTAMPLMSFRSALSGRTARLLRFGWRRRRVRGLLLPAGGVRVGACLRGQHRAGQRLRPQQGARVGVLRRSHTADARPHGRDRPCRLQDRQGPVLGDPRLARNGLASRPSKPEC
jgi:hypothetical protein